MTWSVSWVPLVALLVSSLSGVAMAATEKRVALVIGNAAYSDITPLLKPTNDAQRVAQVLKGLGYEVILGINASKLELESLAQKFRVAVKDAKVGFFYYSGHGFQTNRVDQQHPVNHIVPVDFKVQEADLTLATLPLDIVVETLKSEARVGLIFMDACRNDPQLAAASMRVASGSKTVTMSRGFSPVNVAAGRPAAVKFGSGKGPTGLLIAYATDPGNVALEGDKGLLSPFTSALVKHMGTSGLSVAEVMGRVSSDVALETEGQQTPWSVASLTAGTYQFLPREFEVLPQSRSKPAQASAPSRSKPAQANAPRQPRVAVAARRSGSGSRGANLPPNLGAGVGAGF